MNIYSQHSEDKFILDRILTKKWQLSPCIVDVGCGDGVHSSNSRLLIENGWNAYLVDANGEQLLKANLLYANNPKVKIFPALIDDHIYRAKLSEIGGWSTWKVVEDTGGIDSRLLSDFIKKEVTQKIGVLSIDIEGKDTVAVKDILSQGIRPEVIIIEGNTEEIRSSQRELICGFGYEYIATLFVNQIFKLK